MRNNDITLMGKEATKCSIEILTKNVYYTLNIQRGSKNVTPPPPQLVTLMQGQIEYRSRIEN